MSDYIIDVMLAVKQALYRERQQKLLLLFSILISAVILQFSAHLQKEAAVFQLLMISSLIAFVSALLFLRDILRFWNPSSSALMQLLQQSPKNIVWVYMFHVQLSPFGIRFRNENTLCFRLLNGDMLQLRIPHKESEKIMENLEKMLVHACFGYSKEKEQLYGIHPELLLRD